MKILKKFIVFIFILIIYLRDMKKNYLTEIPNEAFGKLKNLRLL
jgi:hypothetical protein